MRWVLCYEPQDDVLALAAPHFPAHLERLEEFRRRGDLLLMGTFEDAQRDGSMSVFRTEQAARDFVAGDPFVQHGVMRRWTLRAWDEQYGDALWEPAPVSR